MNSFFKIIILVISSLQLTSAQNELLFFQTNWGFEGSWEDFFSKTKNSGYDGIEVWIPADETTQEKISKGVKKHNLKVIYLCGTNRSLLFEKSLANYRKDLMRALVQKPHAINSHTGSDFFTTEQNLAFLQLANRLSKEYNIPVTHETHRGRFSYSLTETKKFLEADSNFQLTLDVSHWMVVHESLLQEQDLLLEGVLNRTQHIHARVGFEEGPQVNDPQAPEWKTALERHLSIWETSIQKRWKEGKIPTITTEFGPPTYLPTEPFTQKPLSDQWEANVFIMNALKERMQLTK